MIGANPNGSTFSVQKTVYRPDLATTSAVKTIMDNFVYDVQGNAMSRVNTFQSQVQKLHQAIMFNKWAEEEQ